MANTSTGMEGPLGPTGDALSAVYLLAVDSISDLHCAPMDTVSPPGLDPPLSPCLPEPLPTKKAPACAEHIAGPPCGPRGLCAMNIFIGFLLLLALANIGLLLYILYLYGHQERLLHSLTDRLDAQMEILQQMAAAGQSMRSNHPREL